MALPGKKVEIAKKCFLGCEDGMIYVVSVTEDPNELKKETKAYKAGGDDGGVNEKRKEGCSCLYGNPC